MQHLERQQKRELRQTKRDQHMHKQKKKKKKNLVNENPRIYFDCLMNFDVDLKRSREEKMQIQPKE